MSEEYEVETVSDGVEAIERIKVDDYRVVISDIRMPRVSGIEVLKEVKALSPGTEVILITGYSTPNAAAQAIRIGAIDCITKPFKIRDIRRVVDNAVKRSMLNSEIRSPT